uniref:uncharacterized protein LOC120328667 n=1 Tax=Styela clava TaxID=7725 RepID=UPI001939F460|nr:uncharacterized protein LOC120328667 [Styela clava]
MALKELEGRAARDIIIVPADKGGGICILSRTDYVAEGMRQLNDKSVYRLLPKDKSRQIGNDVVNLCSKMKEAGVIDDKLAESILPKDPKPGRLRLQPKIHKENHPSRPIISTNGTATEKLSAYVDYKLTPLMSNSLHPTIKFTFECSTNWITFLDVKVHIINNKLETEIFSKETDSHQYLSPSSCHPKHVTKNIPKSLFIRIRRTCSTNEFFDKHAKILKTYLTKRNYKENLVDDAIQSAKELDRKLLLIPKTETKKETLLPFITSYHPTQPNIRKIFSDYQYILDNNDRLKVIFPKPPRLAYRKCPTLRDKLVRAKLKPETPVKKNPGFFKCGRKSCSTCQYSEERKIATNKQKTAEIRIRQKVTCNSENVIYLISCKKCGMQYIGETGRHLKYRITEHIRSIKTQNKDLVVGTHFSQPGHSLKYFSVIGIEKLFHDHIYRKNKESHYIHLFGTHEPQGMNIKEV